MMGKFTDKQKAVLSKNISRYKTKFFQGRGGSNRLAKELNVSPQIVSHWIHGRRIPNIYQLYILARIFDVSIQRLCGLSNRNSGKDIKTPIDVIIRIMQNENQPRKSTLTCKKRQKLLESLKLLAEYEIKRIEENHG